MNTLTNIAKEYGMELSRFFSSGVLTDLVKTGKSEIASRLFETLYLSRILDENTSLRNFYDSVFIALNSTYRNEYIYKNALAGKILLGKHNLNTASMLTELRVGNRKADAVILNGTSYVYEIKSVLDGYSRLENQLEAYSKVFDFISVVTDEEKFQQVESRLPDNIGIMVLARSKYQFRQRCCYRKPESNKSRTNSVAIFEVLNQSEYLSVIEREFGENLREVPNTQIYRIASDYFAQLRPEIAHDNMVDQLKRRRRKVEANNLIASVPISLKAAAISLRLKPSEQFAFLKILDERADKIFS